MKKENKELVLLTEIARMGMSNMVKRIIAKERIEINNSIINLNNALCLMALFLFNLLATLIIRTTNRLHNFQVTLLLLSYHPLVTH